MERSLAGVPGVAQVSGRPATGNVLISYRESETTARTLLSAIGKLLAPEAEAPAGPQAGEHPDVPSGGPADDAGRGRAVETAERITGVLREQAGRFGRARIAVRGIDRDPQLARRVVAALERRPEVRRAAASVTTGRVLVEFSHRVTSIQDLLTDLSRLELPDLPGEDRPAHPLDPGPLRQAGARVAGSALGLGLLAVRTVFGSEGAPVAPQVPAAFAGVVGIIDGAPPVRDGLRRALGHDGARLVLSGTAIVSLTLSGSPLGLLVTGAGALRLFTEARLRRDAWRDYERRVQDASPAQAGAVVRLDTGMRVPLRARVIEGVGTLVGGDGLPDGVSPGDEIEAGARVLHGALVAELVGERAWTAEPRPAPPRPDTVQRYMALVGPASVGYAILHALRLRSLGAVFTGLLLVNPRGALIGSEAADTGASARVLRAGVTVVGTRTERQIRRPDVLILDGPRVLTDGLEQTRVTAVGGRDRAELAETVAAIVAASGAPWGPGLPFSRRQQASEAEFDGSGVSATIAGRRLRLERPQDADEDDPEVRRAVEAGEQTLILREESAGAPIAYVHLRPRLAPGVEELRRRCQKHGVEWVLLERGDRRASRMVASRAEVPLILEADLVDVVRARQRRGDRVAVVSDTPAAAEAFEACDLAIGLSSGRSSHFQARADLLAPGLPAVASIVAAGVRRNQAADISVGISVAANLAGAVWGMQGEPGLLRASHATYLGALGGIGAAWERLHGGRRSRSIISRLIDPRPERWGRMRVAEVLTMVESRTGGLSADEAEARLEVSGGRGRRNALMSTFGEQLQSPLVAVLAGAAGLSVVMGATADAAIIAAVIAANAAVGAWQERQAGKAAQALEQMAAPSGRVLRGGAVQDLPAEAIVRGDILLLGTGDRVVADVRLLEADALEVDEAALTGESLPVSKAPAAEQVEARVILEGSDVTVGSGKAVVVAVGEGTRLGATAAALAVEETSESPLGQRLDRLFRQGMPVVIAGGALVALAGIAWGGAPLAQLAVGASVAVAAVPEGLPLLAGVAEASVARRLAGRSALVRRLSAVEALGRVDVVCADKTGTLTRGELAVTLLDDLQENSRLPGRPSERAAAVLLAAALASPSPDSPDALAHPTDGAVLAAAAAAGLEPRLQVSRVAEAPFDPVRALHATALTERVYVKGAAEVVIPRCVAAIGPDGSPRDLGEADQATLLLRAESLASSGLRVLTVAQGSGEASVEDPRGLTAVGFVGISDPLRPGAANAVQRCAAAGIRVIMLTGDHPATARAIAAEAGLPLGPKALLTGEEIGHVENAVLSESLAGVSVVARITPIDKLRIVECLQRSGHTVAMTGDGVNDAPALRLADVGVAMGAGGTEVARQAGDLILADDRFETLTEALLEGRSLWQNLHGALGLLLGGNLGEVGLMAGAAVIGRGALLNPRQILAVNLVTDVLPAVAVAVQPPRERRLQHVTREGRESFDAQLMRDIVRRGTATAVPALAAVLAAGVLRAPVSTVAFASIIVPQLAQTLQAGRSQESLSPSVLAAMGGSGGLLGLALAAAPVRRFLGLAAPNLTSLLLIGATAPAATMLAGRLSANEPAVRALPAGPQPG